MSEKPVTREEFEQLEARTAELEKLAWTPDPEVYGDVEPAPVPEPTQDFDAEVESLCLSFAGRVMNVLTEELKAVVMAALDHYVELTTRNNDGGGVEPDQFTRAFREALNHAPESKLRNLLRDICLTLDGGLPSPIKSRVDVYGYVEPVEGDPSHAPSHR